MNKLLYPKLALINIQRNGKFCFPYLLTCVGTAAMFYIMCFIKANGGVRKMPGAHPLEEILGFGTAIIGIFAAVFLFYTNSFLMKRRKKEIGLYNILGMEKRHIARIMFYETAILGAGTIVLGLGLGVLLSKLVFMLLFKLLNFTVPFGFSISLSGIQWTVLLFAAIFFLILLSNLLQIRLSSPIALLYGSSAGEREPKTKWALALIGVLCLGTGYYIALTTESPLDAVNLFFIAVLLVMTGTYCLFTAVSIAVLKTLRKIKGYYYKPKHFISVSGLLYRMKQNAVGLANICILSTMVLVMVSTTVSLYIGIEDLLNSRFPADIIIEAGDPKAGVSEKILKAVKDTVAGQGRTIRDLQDYHYLNFAARKDGEAFVTDVNGYYTSVKNISDLCFVTSDDYNRLTGGAAQLNRDEVLVFAGQGKLGHTFTLFGKPYYVKQRLNDFPIKDISAVIDQYFIVVSDQGVLNEIYGAQRDVYKKYASPITYYIGFDLDGSKDEKIACFRAVTALTQKSGEDAGAMRYISRFECRQASESDCFALYGGFLFLGLFLGLLFLMATVLIIYYKQIAEGYDDRGRFEIMQKVGLEQDEIKSTIRSQILKVFFLPLVMAIVHIAFAFKMITKLLKVLYLTNVGLFALCTALTIAVFAAIYAAVYALTAKVYYKIIS